MEGQSATSLDPIIALAKRRGFVYQTAELYGGANGLFDLGPYGVELARRIKERWWQRFVLAREDVVGVDAALVTPEVVLKASGHVDNFSDPLIECLECHIRLRADHYLDEADADTWQQRWAAEAIKQRGIGEGRARDEAQKAWEQFARTGELACPNCGKVHWSEPRAFNMMFRTQLGAVEGAGSTAYLRPETAQGIFTNYKNVIDSLHLKLPFGIAQQGKAFRNEITTGNFLFRVRELEQMEIEFFCKPGEDEHWFATWLQLWDEFLKTDMGLPEALLRQYEHPQEKLSHYSKRTVDHEFHFPFGWGELTGVANRTDFDLAQHQAASGRPIEYFDEATRERYLPYVIEPTMGVGRLMLAVLVSSYREYPQGRTGEGEAEYVLHLPAHLAPVQVAVLPLMKKDGLAEKAREIQQALVAKGVVARYDDTGAIGKRYRRNDEIGTPRCITIDYQTLEDGTVTVRDRDSMEQVRVGVGKL